MKLYTVLALIVTACQAQDWYSANSRSYSDIGPYTYDNRYDYPYETGKYLDNYQKEMSKKNKKNDKTNPFSPKYEEFAASKEFNQLGLLGRFGLGYDRRTKDSSGFQEPLTPQILKTVGVGYWGRITRQKFPEKY